MSALPAPIEVFYSYADADEPFCIELEKHLSLLLRDGIIVAFHKRQISAGTNKSETIDEHLNTASLILLLISVDFVSSDYCYGIEMQRAMQRQHAGEARVIPLLLRPVDNWQGTPFGELQALPGNGMPVISWPNQDDAFVAIARGIRAALQEIQPLTGSIPSTTLPRLWNIPYPRNPFFTGRDELFTRLSTALKRGQATALSQPQAISGLGGIGKTQMALEFAYRHRQDYQTVLWTLADTRESLVSGYVAIAGLLKLPERDAEDQQMVIEAVKNWLQTHGSWLLILDNADDLAMVRAFIPAVFSGHLLLTTRAQNMGRMASRIEVEVMNQDMGALFLLRRVGLVAEDASLDTASSSDAAIAREICAELGGLPLALDQAGAYIEETQGSLTEYLRLYRTRRSELLNARGGLVDDHREPVGTTWSLSFEIVEEKNPAAADLLRFCAFLHSDAIPEEMLIDAGDSLGPLLQPLASDPLLLNAAIATLGAYSLIRRNGETKTLSVHRLVQAVLKDAMDEPTRQLWAERTVLAVNKVFPEGSFPTWPQCERYLSHALVCADLVEQEQIKSQEAARLLNDAGYYLKCRARYSEALPLYRRALETREQQLGLRHPDTALSLNNLATLYHTQGKYEQALPLLKRALEIREQQLGLRHPDTARSLNSLAYLYDTQGKYEQALPLYRRALEICELQLGETHPDTALSLNNLATLYYTQGKYEEALPLLKRALEIKEQQLGLRHPDTALSLNNLATLYYRQGKYEEALPLLKRALEIREQQLGLRHPDTARSLNNLANLYNVQGKYKKALPLYQRALEIYEKALGPEHPNVASNLNNLAMLYKAQGNYEEALPLYQRALEIYERALGTDHPHTRIIRGNYAALQRKLETDRTSS